MNVSELVSQNFIHYQDYLYVKDVYLTDNFKIPSSVLQTGAAAYLSKSSINWKHIHHQGCTWFDYTYIPIEVLTKYGVHQKDQLISEFKDALLTEESQDNKLYQMEMLAIQVALSNSDVFIGEFKFSSLKKDKLKSYCNSYAVLFLFQKFTHLKMYEQFNLYQATADSNFSFQTISLNHFYAKMKDIKKYGIARSLIHKGISNKNAAKMLQYHENLISHFYRQGNKLSQRDIYIKVNTILKSKNEPEISLSSVKQILLKTYYRNLDDIARNGETWMKNSLLPFLIRNEPEYPGDHWQIDATRLQIFCKEESKQGSFLWIAVVIDAHSRMIMGFAIGDKECPDLYTRALKTAFGRSQLLPAEILRDNYKGFTQDSELTDLINQTEKMGVRWRAHKVGNPRDKGIVERFFGVFNTVFCKSIVGYTGEGIKSRSINARPNPGDMKLFRELKLLKNKDQIIIRITEDIHKYNQCGINKNDLSPIEKFNSKETKNAIDITSELYALIFYKKKILKVNRSTICIHSDGCSYFYQLSEVEHILQYNRIGVQVRYDPTAMGTVHLFTEHDSRYITMLTQVKPVSLAQINHDKEDAANLHCYYSKNHSLIKQLRQLIEQREAAIDALDLPVAVLNTEFDENNESVFCPIAKKMEPNHIQLPTDKTLQKEKIFKKHHTLFSEMQDYLYKKKGSGKRLQ